MGDLDVIADEAINLARMVAGFAAARPAGGTLGRQEEDDLLDALDALKNVENAR